MILQGGVTGTGAIVKFGTERMRLLTPLAGPLVGGSNSYVGDVLILDGQLITNPSALRGNVTNFGELQLSQSGGGSYTSNISGTGTVTIGGGSILLSGSNSISGGILINDTNVGVTSDVNLGAANGTVILNDDATVLRLISPITSNPAFVLTAGVSPTIEAVAGISNFLKAPSGSGSLLKTGAGAITTPSFQIGSLSVRAGEISLQDPIKAGVSRVTGLSFGGTIDVPAGKLDLGPGALVIDYPTAGPTPLDTVRRYIKAAFNGGSWNGAGLTSRSAQSSPAAHKTALGYAESPAVGLDNGFNGVPTDPTAVIVRYTYAGNVNLDLTVNSSDFARLSTHFNESGATWFRGDMNYDGKVNAMDFNILAQNYGQTLAAPALGASVPEPAQLFSLAALSVMAIRRVRCVNAKDA